MPDILLLIGILVLSMLTIVDLFADGSRHYHVYLGIIICLIVWFAIADSYKEVKYYDLYKTPEFVCANVDNNIINVTQKLGKCDIDPEKHKLKVIHRLGFSDGIYWSLHGREVSIVEKEVE